MDQSVFRLAPSQYFKVKRILIDVISPEVRAIALGNNQGTIYTDSETDPRAALVWSPGIEEFYLIGDPEGNFFPKSLRGSLSKSLDMN